MHEKVLGHIPCGSYVIQRLEFEQCIWVDLVRLSLFFRLKYVCIIATTPSKKIQLILIKKTDDESKIVSETAMQ